MAKGGGRQGLCDQEEARQKGSNTPALISHGQYLLRSSWPLVSVWETRARTSEVSKHIPRGHPPRFHSQQKTL